MRLQCGICGWSSRGRTEAARIAGIRRHAKEAHSIRDRIENYGNAEVWP